MSGLPDPVGSIGVNDIGFRDDSRDLRNQFITREGTYKLMTLSEYTRPSRMPPNGTSNTPVRVSFVRSTDRDTGNVDDRICFNVGKELYVYPYNGIRKAADLTRPLDKRLYRGTSPTCHDFNSSTARTDRLMLVIGFSAGQVQLVDPVGKEMSKLFNEERLIDRSKVTCIRWLPDSPNQFLVSHASGQLYVYHEELPCCATAPTYQLFKQGDGFSVYTCKAKSTRNPLYRWLIDGSTCINEFAFSPCSRYLAVVSQDGFLRIYNFDCIELISTMKSYFGGLLCVCWSPDGKYVITGGEDDLVTVWSFADRRVICRGRGHTSWVNVVSFDPYTTIVDDGEGFDLSGSDDETASTPQRPSPQMNHVSSGNASLKPNSLRNSNKNLTDASSVGEPSITSYRFGSVGQDTQLCLWDLTEDILRRPVNQPTRNRTSASVSEPPTLDTTSLAVGPVVGNHLGGDDATSNLHNTSLTLSSSSGSSLTNKFGTLALSDGDGRDAKNSLNSLGKKSKESKSSSKSANAAAVAASVVVVESSRLLGTQACPSLHEVPLIEPLTCKKIAHERLTSLVFRDECFVTSCQEGNVYTWARPNRTLNSVNRFC